MTPHLFPLKRCLGFSGQGDVTLLGRRGARALKLPSTSVLFQLLFVIFILSSDSVICVFDLEISNRLPIH